MLDIKRIAHSLSCLSFFSNSSPITWERITAGESHFCFKVWQGEQQYFAKYIGDRDASNELVTLKVASLSGLAPILHYSDKDWIITQFIEHSSLSEYLQLEGEDEATAISRAIKAMALCHKMSADIEPVDFNSLLNSITNHDFISAAIESTINTLRSDLFELSSVESLVLCHGDINFSNVLVSPSGDDILLIDYECSSYAEREFDIAMMMAINDISQDKVLEVIAQYEKFSGLKSPKRSIEKVTRYMVLSFYINALWFYAEYKKQSSPHLLIKAQRQKKRLIELIEGIKKGSL